MRIWRKPWRVSTASWPANENRSRRGRFCLAQCLRLAVAALDRGPKMRAMLQLGMSGLNAMPRGPWCECRSAMQGFLRVDLKAGHLDPRHGDGSNCTREIRPLGYLGYARTSRVELDMHAQGPIATECDGPVSGGHHRLRGKSSDYSELQLLMLQEQPEGSGGRKSGQYNRSRLASSSSASICRESAPAIWSASTCP